MPLAMANVLQTLLRSDTTSSPLYFTPSLETLEIIIMLMDQATQLYHTHLIHNHLASIYQRSQLQSLST